MCVPSENSIATHSDLTLTLATTIDEIRARQMFRRLVKDIWDEYKEELSFSKSGKITSLELDSFISACLAEKRFYIARSNQRIVGFIALSVDKFCTRCIEYAFVEKDARGVGIGTKLYQLAIAELGALTISLLFRRVSSRITYWQSLGFRSITFQNSQSTRYGSIVKLSVEEFPSILSCKLESKSIWTFRKRLQKAELQIKTIDPESDNLCLKVSLTPFSAAFKRIL